MSSDGWIELAAADLRRARRIAEAENSVPAEPGLYAVHGDAGVWRELGLGDPPDDRPLYVGKAEDSLLVRDLKTHFGDGRTGSSTVRRSFAALLHDALELRGMPRNPAKPERPANYGLAPEHDARLTRWMRERLALATWARPSECAVPLVLLEDGLIDRWQPPLNLNRCATRWTADIKAARVKMASEARAWMARTR